MKVVTLNSWIVFLCFAAWGFSQAQELRSKEVFENNSLFTIEVGGKESDWKDCGDRIGDREYKTTKYTFSLENHSTNDLGGIRGSYLIYRDRDDCIVSEHYDLKEVGVVRAGETVNCSAKNQASYKRSNPRDFLNEVIGIRARFLMTLADGAEIIREVKYPRKLSDKKCPWAEPIDTSNLPDPSGYPDKDLSEEDVKNLVKRYIKAVDRKDYETWLALLSPMHPGDDDLEERCFLSKANRIDSIDIKEIDGLNVVLEVEEERFGRTSKKYLQVHSSGHIKYTPLVFKHPVSDAFVHILVLTHEDVTLRNTGVNFLKENNIPLFGYEATGPSDEYLRSASKVFDWLVENGRDFDSTEPKVKISEAEFTEVMKIVKSHL